MAQIIPYQTYLTANNGTLDTDIPPGPWHCVAENVSACQSFHNGAGNCGGGPDNCIESYIRDVTANDLSTVFTLSVQLDPTDFPSYDNLGFSWSYYRHFYAREAPPTGTTPIPKLTSSVGDQQFDEGAFTVSSGFPEFELISHSGTVSAPNGVLTATLSVDYNSPILPAMYWDFQFHTISLRVTPSGSNPPSNSNTAVIVTTATVTDAQGNTYVTTSTSPPTQTSTNGTSNKSSTPVGAIVGGVVGGIAIIALAAVAFFLITKKTKKNKKNPGVAGYAEKPGGANYSTVPQQPLSPQWNVSPYQNLPPGGHPQQGSFGERPYSIAASSYQPMLGGGGNPPWAGSPAPGTEYSHSTGLQSPPPPVTQANPYGTVPMWVTPGGATPSPPPVNGQQQQPQPLMGSNYPEVMAYNSNPPQQPTGAGYAAEPMAYNPPGSSSGYDNNIHNPASQPPPGAAGFDASGYGSPMQQPTPGPGPGPGPSGSPTGYGEMPPSYDGPPPGAPVTLAGKH